MTRQWLLSVFPHAWRQRYGEEFLALLETERPSLRLVVDVLVSALDAWLRPQVGPASVAAAVGHGRGGRGGPFEKFTRRSRNVLQFAAEEAGQMHQHYIGTEHLLLGLVREREGVAMAVLRSLEVDPSDVRAAVEARVGPGIIEAEPARGLSPQAKKAIHLSVEEAQRLRHSFVGTEHLLLGLMRLGEGVAAEVLTELGEVDLAEYRRRVVRVLNNK